MPGKTPCSPYQDRRRLATFQGDFQVGERGVHLVHVLVAVVQVVFRGHDGQLVDVVLEGKDRVTPGCSCDAGIPRDHRDTAATLGKCRGKLEWETGVGNQEQRPANTGSVC